MAITETPPTIAINSELHVDRFGLSIGRASVGLPLSCTSDMVLHRYVDLIRLIQVRPGVAFSPPEADIATLADAINATPEFVNTRLQTLAG